MVASLHREYYLNGAEKPYTNGLQQHTANGQHAPMAQGKNGLPNDHVPTKTLNRLDRPLSNENEAPLQNGHAETSWEQAKVTIPNGHLDTLNGSGVLPNGCTSSPDPPAPPQTPIAVLGMSCRLPGGCNNPNDLWNFISQGSIASNKIPKSRFNVAGHFDGSRMSGSMPSAGGMCLDEIDIAGFDASFFNISVPEAISMDPQQRLLLSTVYECLENSGVTLEKIRRADVGCLVSAGGGEPFPNDRLARRSEADSSLIKNITRMCLVILKRPRHL